MNRRFEVCVDRVLAHEDAAWVPFIQAYRQFGPGHPEVQQRARGILTKRHPADPGGSTRLGITLETFRRWRGDPSLTERDLDQAAIDEIKAIYHSWFWNTIRADDLPFGVDYAVFDFAVNSGPRRAVRFLQGLVNATQDGVVGQETLAKVRAYDRTTLIDQLCNARLCFLRGLPAFSTFGKGWTRRVEEVRAAALEDARGRLPVVEVAQTDTAKGAGFVAGVVAVVTPLVEVARQLLPLFEGLPPYAAAAIIAVVAAGAVWAWRARRA